MFEKMEYALTRFLVEGNFLKKNRLSGLIEISNSTHDLKLEDKINVLLDLVDLSTEEDSGMNYEEWKELILRRRDELILYLDGMLAADMPIWKIIAGQHGWVDPTRIKEDAK